MTARRPPVGGGPAVRRGLVALLAVAVVAPLAACTQDEVDPERTRTVVVAVDSPFGSLNAGLPEGRTPGSELVRGLVSDGFVGLDEAGAAVADTAFGTVEKVADDPLTVRYTIAAGARWSDGVPVSPADLLLEWAARSGQFDEAAPGQAPAPTPTPSAALDTPAPPDTAAEAPEAATPDPATSPVASPAPSPTPTREPVRFGATSAALIAASATPTLDAQGLTVVYDHPVADWQVALDVNLPAHVVGRRAFEASDGPAPTATGAAASAPAAPVWSEDAWAAQVADAIVRADRDALARVADAWRTGWDADALGVDAGRAVTTGPYRIAAVDPAGSVELLPNSEYRGSRPASRERIVVRWDLDPLAAVDALRRGDVDVVAPVVTPDVTAALYKLTDVQVSTGGGAVFQLALNEAGGPFSAAGYAAAGDDAAATAATVRTAFLSVAADAGLAAVAGVEPSEALLATAGPARETTPAVSSSTADLAEAGITDTVPVRVLVATGDPVRAAVFEALTEAALAAGFEVEAAEPADPASALWEEPEAWDAALVPVTQAELPVAATADRWRTGGATNVTGHSDADLDALLDQLVGTVDPAASGGLLDQVAASVRDAHAVLPIARQPALTATVQRAAGSGLPQLGELPAVPWGDADLAPWWSWATE